MEIFMSWTWFGGAGVMAALVWRLLVAMETQRKLQAAITESETSLDRERQELGLLITSQTDTLNSLTEKNSTLQEQIVQAETLFQHIKADHQALQQKYTELEQNLLESIAQEKSLTEQLQTKTLEQSKLQRQVALFQKQQTQQKQAQQALQLEQLKVSDKNQLYQKAVQAAKRKIEVLEREKKQLERDLQQALYQVVALEQAQGDDGESYGTSPTTDVVLSEPSLPMFQ